MTVEELLSPRYRIIGDYPNSPYQLNSTIEIDKDPLYKEAWYDDYPNIFQKREWWHERKIGDMPDYMKVIKTITETGYAGNFMNDVCTKNQVIYCSEKDKFHTSIYNDFINSYSGIDLKYFIPITKEEYHTTAKSEGGVN